MSSDRLELEPFHFLALRALLSLHLSRHVCIKNASGLFSRGDVRIKWRQRAWGVGRAWEFGSQKTRVPVLTLQ